MKLHYPSVNNLAFRTIFVNTLGYSAESTDFTPNSGFRSMPMGIDMRHSIHERIVLFDFCLGHANELGETTDVIMANRSIVSIACILGKQVAQRKLLITEDLIKYVLEISLQDGPIDRELKL